MPVAGTYLGGALVVLVGLSLSALPVFSVQANTTREVQEKLEKVLKDKELAQDIVEYLELVPLPHHALPQARSILGDDKVPAINRIGAISEQRGIILDAFNSIIKGIHDFQCQHIFHVKCDNCSKVECPSCPDLSKCPKCPVPCPVPAGCRYPDGICNCDGMCTEINDPDEFSTTTAMPQTSAKPHSTSRQPQTTTGAPADIPTGQASTTTSRPQSSTEQPSTSTRTPSKSPTKMDPTTTKEPVSSTKRPPPTTTSPNLSLSSTTRAPKRTTRRSRPRRPSTPRPTKRPKTTKKQINSKRPRSGDATNTTSIRPSPSAIPMMDKLGGNITMNQHLAAQKPDEEYEYYDDDDTDHKESGGADGGKESKFESNGISLFYKNVKKLVKNETYVYEISSLLDNVPETTGGREMELAHKILTKFGDIPKAPVQKPGSPRFYAFQTARGNTRGIIGDVLDFIVKSICKCDPCLPKCEVCTKKCPKSNRCPPCKCDSCECDCTNPDLHSYSGHQRRTMAPYGRRLPKAQMRPRPKQPAAKMPRPPQKTYGPPKKTSHQKGVAPHKARAADPPVSPTELATPLQCRGFTCPFKPQCGVANLNPLTPRGSQRGYMVNGEPAKAGEWPMYVRLTLHHGGNMVGLCGGVLISDRHVLTAGHCVVNNGATVSPVNIEVHVGDHDRDAQDPKERSMRAISVCRTSRYEEHGGTKFDYSVVTLSQAVQISDYVAPACLPYDPINAYRAKCYVVGMGVTRYLGRDTHHPEYSPLLQKMQVNQVSCARWGFGDADRSRHCFTKANAPGDTCGGDSGGPIVCMDKHGRWTVMGLVSYGSTLCDGTESVGWVGVYTRVDALMKYIQSDCGI